MDGARLPWEKEEKAFSAAPLTQAPAWLRYCGNQANSWLCVCCDNGERFPASQRCSAVFAEINPASWVVPDSRVCLCQLSAMPLRSPLSAARRSVPCFSSSFCTDGWHSCSAGPRGLLKKAINQSRHSIQAGNWPIRVAQDAYIHSGIFTNWLSIYTKLGDSTRKIHLFTCLNRRILFSRRRQTPRFSVPRPRYLITHPSFNTHDIFMTPNAAISGTAGRCDQTWSGVIVCLYLEVSRKNKNGQLPTFSGGPCRHTYSDTAWQEEAVQTHYSSATKQPLSI